MIHTSIHVLQHIFSFLTFKEMGRAGSVCKLWYETANTPYLWRSFDQWLSLSADHLVCLLKQQKFFGIEQIKLDMDTMCSKVYEALLVSARHTIKEVTICGTRGEGGRRGGIWGDLYLKNRQSASNMMMTKNTEEQRKQSLPEKDKDSLSKPVMSMEEAYNHMASSKLLDLGFILCRFRKLHTLRFCCIIVTNPSTHPFNYRVYPLSWLSALYSLSCLEFIRCPNMHFLIPPPSSYSQWVDDLIYFESEKIHSLFNGNLYSSTGSLVMEKERSRSEGERDTPILDPSSSTSLVLSIPPASLAYFFPMLKKVHISPLPPPLPPYLKVLKIKYCDSMVHLILPAESWLLLSDSNTDTIPRTAPTLLSLTHFEYYSCLDTNISEHLIETVLPILAPSLEILHISLPASSIHHLPFLTKLHTLYLIATQHPNSSKNENSNTMPSPSSIPRLDELSLSSLSRLGRLHTLHLQGFWRFGTIRMRELKQLRSLKFFSVDNFETISLGKSDIKKYLPNCQLQIKTVVSGPRLVLMDNLLNMRVEYRIFSRMIGYFESVLTYESQTAYEFYLDGKIDLAVISLDMMGGGGMQFVRDINSDLSKDHVPVFGHIDRRGDIIPAKYLDLFRERYIDVLLMRPPALSSVRGIVFRLVPHIIDYR